MIGVGPARIWDIRSVGWRELQLEGILRGCALLRKVILEQVGNMGRTWRDMRSSDEKGDIMRRSVEGYQEEPIPRPWICKWASVCGGHLPALLLLRSCASFRSRHRSPWLPCNKILPTTRMRSWWRYRSKSRGSPRFLLISQQLSQKIYWHYKVGRCLARYSPHAKANNAIP